MTTMRGFTMFTRIITAALLVATVSAGPAAAEGVTPSPTTTAPPSSTFAAQFNSLAGAMLNFYAASSGTSLQAFIAANPTQVASLTGSTASLPALAGTANVADLQGRLQLSGVSLNLPALTSLPSLLTELNTKAGTVDGRMTLFGASFATDLGALRVPALAMPSLDGTTLPTATMPVESLAFGLFANASLTDLVANHPDVFAQVRTSGLGTPQALNAWKSSMLQAGTALGSNLSRLPMPCLAEMLQGMATGVSAGSSSGCASCAVAGSYLHNQASGLLDPNKNASGATATAPMQPWLQDALNQANPGLSSQMGQIFSPNGSLTACSASQGAASAALSSMLPGLFANLAPGAPTAPTTPALPGGFGSITPGATLPAPTLPGGFGALQPK
jgi:hypothetical protein